MLLQQKTHVNSTNNGASCPQTAHKGEKQRETDQGTGCGRYVSDLFEKNEVAILLKLNLFSCCSKSLGL